MKRSKIASVLAAVLALILVMSACAAPAPASETQAPAAETQAPAQETVAPAETKAAETPAPEEPGEPFPGMETLKGSFYGSLTPGAKEEAPSEGPAEDPADEAEALDVSPLADYLQMRGGTDWAIEPVESDELSDEEAADMDRAMRAFASVTDAVIVNDAEHFYYYEKLDSLHQDIYDAMYLLAEDPTSTDHIVSFKTTVDPNSSEFNMAYSVARLALGYDHPELWWMYYDNGSYSYKCKYTTENDGSYTIRLQMNEAYEDFEKDVKAFNDAVRDFVKGIDTGAGEKSVALQVHDKLISLVTYDHDVLDRVNNNKSGSDLAHTAFGALVHNTAGVANRCVCDGYSLAYTYILQQLGMEATVVCGKAGNANSLGGHAWSIVKIENKWYEVDSTWDDYTELEDEIREQYAEGTEEFRIFMEMVHDTAHMNKILHYMYAINTAQIQNYTPPSDLVYHTKDGRWKITLIGSSERTRYCDYESTKDNPKGVLTRLLPVADGTLLPEDEPVVKSDENSAILGTYYVIDFNGSPEETLIQEWGEDYYGKLAVFTLNEGGTGTLTEDGTERALVFSLSDGTLTLAFADGWINLKEDGEHFVLTTAAGDVLTYARK